MANEPTYTYGGIATILDQPEPDVYPEDWMPAAQRAAEVAAAQQQQQAQAQAAATRTAVPASGAVETMPGAREAHARQGVLPPMRQRTPFTTVTAAVGPNGSVTPLIGYPSQYPHVINAINDPVAVVGPWLELVQPRSFERRDIGRKSGGGGGGGGGQAAARQQSTGQSRLRSYQPQYTAGNPDAFLPGTVGPNSVLRGIGDIYNPSLRAALSSASGAAGTNPSPAVAQAAQAAAAQQPVAAARAQRWGEATEPLPWEQTPLKRNLDDLAALWEESKVRSPETEQAALYAAGLDPNNLPPRPPVAVQPTTIAPSELAQVIYAANGGRRVLVNPFQ